jgi:hypothetical protein
MTIRVQQELGRLAVGHGYRQTLLWAVQGPVMLAPYAHNPVYPPVLLIGIGMYGRHCGDRVQMGRRGRGDALQRSTPPECSKGGAEGSTDLHRSEDHGTVAGVPACSFAAARGEGLYELWAVGTDGRPGLHEHGYGLGRCVGSTGRAAGRYGARDHGRRACSGSAGRWRPIYDYTGRSRRAHHPDGDQGPHRHHLVLVARRDVPRSPAFAAVADESGQKALVDCRRSASPRSSGRTGRPSRHRQVRLGR